MKKLLAVLLAVAMLFVLAACKQSDEGSDRGDTLTTTEPTAATTVPTEPTTTAPVRREPMMGEWSCKIIVDARKLELEGVDATMECHIEAEFNEDMTYRVTIDQDALNDSVEQFIQDVTDDLIEITYQQFEGFDLTREQVDIMFQQTYNMTLEEKCRQMLDEIDVKEMIAEHRDMLPAAGTYRVDGDILYLIQPDGEGDFEEVAFTYQLENDKLRLSSEDEDIREFFEFIGGSYLEFIRK